MNFFLWRVDYTSEGKRSDWANVIFAAYFILTGHDTHFLRLLLFLVGMICPWCKSISFDLFWNAVLFIAAK